MHFFGSQVTQILDGTTQIGERYGIGAVEWRALTDAIFPLAESLESILMAISYCKARNLDVFKRPVHIVPIWNSKLGRLVDTIWPGIGELRTTAARTGEYAGIDALEVGAELKQKVGNVELTFPEWMRVTVYRIVKGERCAFVGPKVYWLETYAVKKRDDDSPNDMWQNRPFGQLQKCCEAAALRLAFPEEVGSDYIPEEVQGKQQFSAMAIESSISAQGSQAALPQEGTKSDKTAEKLKGKNKQATPAPEASGDPGSGSSLVGADGAGSKPPLVKDVLAAIKAEFEGCESGEEARGLYDKYCGPDGRLTPEHTATVSGYYDETIKKFAPAAQGSLLEGQAP